MSRLGGMGEWGQAKMWQTLPNWGEATRCERREQSNEVGVLTLNPLPNHHFLSLWAFSIYGITSSLWRSSCNKTCGKKIWCSFPNTACEVLSSSYNNLVPETNLEVFRMCFKLFYYCNIWIKICIITYTYKLMFTIVYTCWLMYIIIYTHWPEVIILQAMVILQIPHFSEK